MDRLFHFLQKLLLILSLCFAEHFVYSVSIDSTGRSIPLAGRLDDLIITKQTNNVCEGKTYEFACNNLGADSYTWELPSGLTINGVSGSVNTTENSVKIFMETAPLGFIKIKVKAIVGGIVVDEAVTGDIWFVTSNCKLDRPEFIDQSKYVCNGSPVKYSVKPVADAAGYEWILPSGLKAQESTWKRFTTPTPEINVESELLLVTDAVNVGRIEVKALSDARYGLESDKITTNEIFVIPQPALSVEALDISSCNTDNGSLTIKGLASRTEYSVSYVKGIDPVGPLVLTSDNQGNIVISSLGEGAYSNFVVKAGGCESNLTSEYRIGRKEQVKINGPSFINPDYCKGKGKIILSLNNAVKDEIYDIDYNNDNITDVTETVKNAGDLEITNLPVGFKLDNEVKITNTVSGCNDKKLVTGEIVNPQSASIDTVIITDPQYCNSNGQVNIKLSNVLPSNRYSIDFNNDKVFEYFNVQLSTNLILDNIRPGVEVKGLLIQNETNKCRDSVLYGKTLKEPVTPSIANVELINPTFCGGTGSLKIKLAEGIENDLYTIRFNEDTRVYSDNIKLSGNIVLVDKIPNGTIINKFEIINNATRCNANRDLNGIITDSPASFTINDVKLNQPLSCNDLGSLEISLTNIADGEKMGVDLNNDLIPEDSLIAKANKIILEDLPNGYNVKNILLTKFSTKCNAGKLFTGTVNPPFLPDVNLPEYKPVCKSDEAFILKGGFPSGGTYLVDDVAATSVIPSVLGVGSHKVIYKYTNTDNCSNSDTAVLVIEDLPKVIIEGDGMNMCPNMAQASYSSVMYRNHNYLWEVEGGQITDGQNLPNVDVMWDKDQDLKKRLKLKITNSISGCFDTTSRAISIVDTIPPFIMDCAENITLKAEAGLNGWEAKLSEANGLKIPEVDDNCADEPLLSFSVNNSGFHELSELDGLNVDALKPASILWQAVDLYENKSECITKIEFDYIEVVPSAFSPNDDATNNTWEINFLFQYPNSVVRVYNRWGIKVFESEKGYPVPWDGTCKGKKVPVDSYYYSIAIGDKNNKELKGNVTVIY